MPYRKTIERIEKCIALKDRDKKPDYPIADDIRKRVEAIYPPKVRQGTKENEQPAADNPTAEN